MSSETEAVPNSVQENQADQASQDDQTPHEDIKPRVEISNKDKQILKDAFTRFTSCGRCSLFLAAYRLHHDDAVLLTAVNNIEGGWLTLPWDRNLRELINKSYGCRIDVEAYYFESCCPDCHGAFVYAELENGQPNVMRLKM